MADEEEECAIERHLHEAAEGEARGVTGGVRCAAGDVAQSKGFTDAGAAAAGVAGAAADGVGANVVALEVGRHAGVHKRGTR